MKKPIAKPPYNYSTHIQKSEEIYTLAYELMEKVEALGHTCHVSVCFEGFGFWYDGTMSKDNTILAMEIGKNQQFGREAIEQNPDIFIQMLETSRPDLIERLRKLLK